MIRVVKRGTKHLKKGKSYKLLPEAIVSKVGRGPKKGQNKFRFHSYTSAVFTFIPLVFYSPFIGSIGLLQAQFF